MKTITIPVPDWANWWTIGSDGEINAWENEPYKDASIGDGFWLLSTGKYKEIGFMMNDPDDWTKELHRIE